MADRGFHRELADKLERVVVGGLVCAPAYWFRAPLFIWTFNGIRQVAHFFRNGTAAPDSGLLLREENHSAFDGVGIV
jgi:hypothetical protein